MLRAGFRSLAVTLQQHSYLLLLAQLAVLLLVLVEGPHSSLGRGLWLCHVGLFLLWQPFVGGQNRLSLIQATLLFALVATVSTTFGWGWLAAWLAFLSSIVGGKVVMARDRRFGFFYLFVFGFLLFSLLVWVAPQIVGGTGVIPEVWVDLIAMSLLVGAALATPGRKDEEVSELYDFVASMLLLLLLTILLLGTTSMMALSRVDYFSALIRTLFGMAALLLLLSWAWNPRRGFGGFGVFVSTYLLRLGFPFDAWLKRMIRLSETIDRPGEFLSLAMETFSSLPWVTGGTWQLGDDEEGRFGAEARHETLFVYGGVHLRLYTGYVWTAALIWQGSLLLKLVVELYRAKVHERAARQMQFMQSVHETGARLTHDVKNLLQSIDSLCYAAEQASLNRSGDGGQGLADLMRKQLPVVSGRLRATVDRLNRPTQDAPTMVPAGRWWNEFSRRFSRDGVSFAPSVLSDCADHEIPVSVFDSVAENLIANAIGKRREEPGLVIRAQLACEAGAPMLVVEDSGTPIHAEMVQQLFSEPVESRTGLGIGLYQSARLAAISGWKLELAVNALGCVRFRLLPARSSFPEVDEPSSDPSP